MHKKGQWAFCNLMWKFLAQKLEKSKASRNAQNGSLLEHQAFAMREIFCIVVQHGRSF